MKNNGFTLVELIAVVVILSIISMLAAPNIVELMQRSKDGSFVSEVNQLVSQARYMYKNNKTRENMEQENDSTYKVTMRELSGNVPTSDPYGYDYLIDDSYISFSETCPASGMCTIATKVHITSCKEDADACRCIYIDNVTGKEITKDDISTDCVH